MATLSNINIFIPLHSTEEILPNSNIQAICATMQMITHFHQAPTTSQSIAIPQPRPKRQLETERPSSSQVANTIIQKAKAILEPLKVYSEEGRHLKLKMYLNKKIGQLTDELAKIKSNANAITQLLVIAKKESEPMGAYAMKALAMALIKQACNQAYINPKAAHPLAWVACTATSQCPDFYYVLFSALFESSTYTVPRYVNKKENETIEEYKQRLGYRLIDGRLESDEFFFERSCGTVIFMASLYCLRSNDIGFTNPYKVEDAWRWLASVCNLPPRMITPALLTSFVEIAGDTLYASYNEDFTKIIAYIEQSFSRMFSKHSQSYTARLKIALEKYKKFQKVNP